MPEQLVGPGGTVVVVTGAGVVGVTGLVVVVTQIGPGTQMPLKPPGAVVVPVGWQVQAALQSLSTPVRHCWLVHAAQLLPVATQMPFVQVQPAPHGTSAEQPPTGCTQPPPPPPPVVQTLRPPGMPVGAQVQLAPPRLVHRSGKVPEMHVPPQIPFVKQTPSPPGRVVSGWQRHWPPPTLMHGSGSTPVVHVLPSQIPTVVVVVAAAVVVVAAPVVVVAAPVVVVAAAVVVVAAPVVVVAAPVVVVTAWVVVVVTVGH